LVLVVYFKYIKHLRYLSGLRLFQQQKYNNFSKNQNRANQYFKERFLLALNHSIFRFSPDNS